LDLLSLKQPDPSFTEYHSKHAMIETVAYVIRSFPEPSETFIAEEALSLFHAGVQPCVIHLHDAKSAVLQPAAQALQDSAPRLRVHQASSVAILEYLLRWATVAPFRTFRTLCKAFRHPNRWCYFQALRPAWWCKEHGVDFMHAHFADVNFQYTACMSEWSGIPFGVTTHRYDILEEPLGFEIARELYQCADAVVTISKFNKEYMVQRYGDLDSKIKIIHCGIDTGRFSFLPRQPQLSGKPLRLLNVGRLAQMKGQDVLLRAMALLKQRGMHLHLDIVGGGELEQELMSLAIKLQVDDCLTFHGVQPEQFVRQLHERADLFVLPSRSEGLPVACIEALAMGTTCIATRITGIPELIESGVNGLLVEAEDADGLAEAIGKLQADPQMAQQMRLNGRATVLAEFDRSRCTQQLIDLWGQSTRSN
jgi:colanic acid/amylovoran biosynthesis glycosyltransferase